MAPSDVQAVLSYYALRLPEVRAIVPVGNAGGWSGCVLWRLADVAGKGYCLRRWPLEHPSEDRLRLIHPVLRIVADGLAVVASPISTRLGATFVRHEGHFWELTEWKPGEADYEQPPRAERLRAAMRVLARFHELSRRYETVTGRAPAIVDRLRRWQSLQSTGLKPLEGRLSMPLGNAIDEPAGRLMSILPRALTRAVPAFDVVAKVGELPLQPAIRDVHREHVLFTGDEVTGLIDFGALRIDTPLADVARLVGSFCCDDFRGRQIALDAYSELRPLMPVDRVIVDALDESGLVIAAVNWLTWLYAERREMGPAGPIVRRFNEISGRLEGRHGAKALVQAKS